MSNTSAIEQSGNGKSVWKFLADELKPKGKTFTWFNIISVPVMMAGVVIIILRFIHGLGYVSNVNQEVPWGLWKGFNVVTGVAFAGGAYVLTFIVYILNVKKYQSIVRVTVLNGFLAYLFYAGALVLDLGRPLQIINPIIGNSFGASSVLFLVAWHFLLYMIAQIIEFSPAIAEWIGAKRARKILSGMTLAAVIFGITLSMLHQSGLGALFLMAKEKIHPLWYTEFIPILFLVSSVFAGLSMVIFEGSISQRVFHNKISKENKASHKSIIHGLSGICAFAMFIYLFLHIIVFVHGKNWNYVGSKMGMWYLTEMLGFVVLPMILYFISYRKYNVTLIKVAALIAMIGIIINRLNVSVIAFRWDAAPYVPSWMEIVVSITIIFAEIWIFRWVIRRLPVLSESPEWAKDH